MFDPTETCGYSMSEQEHLLNQIRKQFVAAEIIEVENKADLMKTSSDRVKISAQTGYGIAKLVDKIVKTLRGQQHL